MAKNQKPPKLPRMSNEEALAFEGDPEMNDNHINDWTSLKAEDASKMDLVGKKVTDHGTFCFAASKTAPKSVRYRQLNDSGVLTTSAGEIPYKRGDYLFVDQNSGKTIVAYKLFKLFF
jgi:hypothetical protein